LEINSLKSTSVPAQITSGNQFDEQYNLCVGRVGYLSPLALGWRFPQTQA